MSDRTRTSFLLLADFERVEEWARSIRILFDGFGPYMVGSVHESADYRDVDLRLILDDEAFDRDWHDPVKLRLMNRALSTWGQRETGLPIDFQIQRQTEANATYPDSFRNPMGLRDWRREVPAGVKVDAASPPAADPLDVERLAEALHAVGVGCSSYICEPTTSTYIGLRKTMHETDAREVAAEYARLAASTEPAGEPLLLSAARRAVGEYFEWEDYQHGKPEYVRQAMDNLDSAIRARPPVAGPDAGEGM